MIPANCRSLVLVLAGFALLASCTGCSETTAPYPSDSELIARFEQDRASFETLLSTPDDVELQQQLGIVDTGHQGAVFLAWTKKFPGGGCVKGYVHFDPAPDGSWEPNGLVEDIDAAVGGPCSEQQELHRQLDGGWYLFYSSWN